jgi:hypothetical protein
MAPQQCKVNDKGRRRVVKVICTILINLTYSAGREHGKPMSCPLLALWLLRFGVFKNETETDDVEAAADEQLAGSGR